MERKNILNSSNFLKEKELLLQKINFLELCNNELAEKEKLIVLEMGNLKKESQQQSRELQQRVEQVQRNCNADLTDLRDKLFESESQH